MALEASATCIVYESKMWCLVYENTVPRFIVLPQSAIPWLYAPLPIPSLTMTGTAVGSKARGKGPQAK